jgi:predicted amidohydrolase YtcJ
VARGDGGAVRDGKILSVGRTLEDLKPWLDTQPYTVNDTLKEKVLLPGFIEAHGHRLCVQN